MKILSVGRDPDCNISIDDPTGLISRRHATIRVRPFGKYELIDLSKNGTTVNSVLVPPSVVKKIKRGDSVVFAGVASLDWKDVPNSMRIWKLLAIALLAVIVVFVSISIAMNLRDNSRLDEETEILNGKIEKSDQPITPPETAVKENPEIRDTKLTIPAANKNDKNNTTEKKTGGKDKKEKNKKENNEKAPNEESQTPENQPTGFL